MRKQSPFIVPLRGIPAEGLELDLELPAALVGAALAGTGVQPDSARLRARVELEKAGPDVFARGEIAGEIVMPCSRCVGPARQPLAAPFELTFLPAGAVARTEEGEVELGPADLDVATYVDEQIDLEEALRAELLLALPIAPLCRDDCKGLCARCGKDLNEGPCACPPEPKDDRWAALRSVKLD